MSVALVLIGGATPDAPMAWVRVQRPGGRIVERGSIGSGAAAPQASPADTVLVLPGSEAQLRMLDQTASSDAQARAAVAYLFKGALASDASDGVYAVGEAQQGGRRLAAALDRRRIDLWLARCAEVRATPSAILLDCAIWPAPTGVVQLVELDGRVIVAGGALGGFTIEAALAPALIQPWLDRLPEHVTRIDAIGFDPAELALGPSARAVPAVDPVEVLAKAAASPPSYAPILRQADFTKTRNKSSPVRAWYLAAALAVLAILLQAGVGVADGMRDAEAARETASRAEADFHKLRPDVKRIVNLRAQVTAALNAAQRPVANPVIATSDRIAQMLRAHGDVRLDEVRHEAPGRSVSLRFSGPQPAMLDAALSDLRQADPALNVGQMETAGGRVSVTVTMVAP